MSTDVQPRPAEPGPSGPLSPSGRAVASTTPGELLLRLVASGLVQLADKDPGLPVYGNATQAAYNHLVLHCLERGAAPPTSIPEMVRWAAEIPIGQWPIDLPDELVDADGYLIADATRSLTQECLEWYVPAPDAAAETFEREIMHAALNIARAARTPQLYVAFRRLLVEHPVLTEAELNGLDDELDLFRDLILQAYRPAPAALLHEDRFHCCVHCGCLLVPARSGGLRCELDRCRVEGVTGASRVLPRTEGGGVRQLARPLRMFITGPGLAERQLELALYDVAATAGVDIDVEMWPRYDAYDLRVVLPGGRVWAVDVKDRVNPALLARNSTALPSDPPYDRGFLVVPLYRFRQREAYRRIFDQHRPDGLSAAVLDLRSDTEFLALIRAELRTPPARTAPARTATATGGSGDA